MRLPVIALCACGVMLGGLAVAKADDSSDTSDDGDEQDEQDDQEVAPDKYEEVGAKNADAVFQGATAISSKYRKASDEKDMVLVACLEEYVDRAESLALSSQAMLAELKLAGTRSDLAEVKRLFNALKGAKKSMKEIRKSADGCKGASSSTGGNKNETIVDPEKAGVNPYGDHGFFGNNQNAASDGETGGLGQGDDAVRPPPASGLINSQG